ncbi:MULTISPECIES: DUF502 domain-containing protein [Fictibacillus]|uniref:DUF502 domain-containing protein n=1 Tax=Fictibacillus enclensis TaxID=1017270 RepID=A0A0V8JE30_9BACL|nr:MULTISPECIES: DUF502 domain-containing protein [Fictibacillus]KSU85285.1 hypothetical protein AS030_07195 [Fictibacillus enclensis]MDM5199125.1 DUF502 domain-containing protein [Fictibacillus enclensis]RXY99049.1 DUF502 domain-containing protein [Fictibacillus sp. S7]SCB94389.1 Uncharacterized membrane protein [Fictibacillus enclensis]
MKTVAKYFMNGILTALPIILVFYVLVKVFDFLDGILGDTLRSYMKGGYIPGIGILATIILLTLLGWLSSQVISGQIIFLLDSALERIPLVKTLYTVIKDTFQSLLGEKKSFSTVVLVEIPATGLKSIGFVTAEDLKDLGDELSEHVAVYIPQTFQIAGFTFLVPKKEVTVLDIKAEDAMKFILSGGVASKS